MSKLSFMQNLTSFNPLQPRNAPEPIEVIPSGRVKLVNPLQLANAFSPISVILAGRFILVNPLQSENVP